MGLKSKLDEDTLALLEVVEDPVFLSEFLRSTSNGEINKELHSKEPFKMRWYQKDLLTDKSRWLSVCGGRAIGKSFAPLYRNV